jgi:hypothetical protein
MAYAESISNTGKQRYSFTSYLIIPAYTRPPLTDAKMHKTFSSAIPYRVRPLLIAPALHLININTVNVKINSANIRCIE